MNILFSIDPTFSLGTCQLQGDLLSERLKSYCLGFIAIWQMICIALSRLAYFQFHNCITKLIVYIHEGIYPKILNENGKFIFVFVFLILISTKHFIRHFLFAISQSIILPHYLHFNKMLILRKVFHRIFILFNKYMEIS